MSFFKKMAASVGIGSATVDTVLDYSQYRPGDTITGTVYVRGGNVEQTIDDIDLYVMSRYIMEKDDKKIYQTSPIASHRVVNGFIIFPKEVKEFPFAFPLPLDTPVTLGSVAIWIKTDIDIKNGVDAGDNDRIQVLPHPWMEKVLKAVQQVGFTLREADCEYAPFFRRRLPFVQEFEFSPSSRDYRGKLDEVEVVCHVEENGIEVALEIDRKARGVLGWLEETYSMDERLVRIYLNKTELNQDVNVLTQKFRAIINQHAR
ncbi:sporulation protein [Aneurinibacillus migulanus]|uniref:sporulation protein n=1 Tax=Aneurinibacillus migulanus TaxID=47500 RepID=UPI0005B76DCD|nr:sporulation protein [Aneurinibacillus migulanus]KIV51574.1 sporulation protein [Aneurinibacillus migulanus]KPD04883.1 sporulation protein [Aneurinibacillus migulanus]CEH31345.1 SpoOM family protein [Aneurinibacillus migulanus]